MDCKNVCVLSIENNSSIHNVKTIKSNFIDAITRFDSIEIDVICVKIVDATIIQLLASAKASAIAQGRKVTLLTERGSPFEACVTAAGLLGKDGHVRTSEERFWTGEAAVEGELI